MIIYTEYVYFNVLTTIIVDILIILDIKIRHIITCFVFGFFRFSTNVMILP